ncbi:MAG: 2-oxoglutarate oxidoreductase [Deltaproteobacteria bacterium RIFCSPHIGHO2_02_FULL_50_15]|nr:MAG: 2-oxoglutarate oxidoreductase [Deltaproteobacteria bacterium RIFCSPHIGHO2_02_FULL_50_15]
MAKNKKVIPLKEHIIEFVSDSGEGAQKAANSFAKTCGMMGNGLWTIEVIPAEIQPPPHTTSSTSGNRIRLAEGKVTNAGDLAQTVVAFNEMAFLSRVQAGAVADDVLLIIDNIWATHDDPAYRESYKKITGDVKSRGGTVIEVPFEEETAKIVEDSKRGKNMFVLGYMGYLYQRDLNILRQIVEEMFAKKSKTVIQNNIALLEGGYTYAEEHLDFRYEIPSVPSKVPMVVMNGNTAIALGSIAAGFELCSMYPITPATSASHALSDIMEGLGGMVHQAEDEIAAIGVAIGSNYAGKPALTITSGPGMALKTEFQGLAVMTETPLVIVDVQRGGPSTGLPTKIEQGDLLSSLFGAPGDAPKVVIAPSTIKDCFSVMIMARKIAEEFRMLVIVLTDANLATGQQIFKRPEFSEVSLPSPIDLSPVPEGTNPFDWDPKTGLSRRLIPGQPGGMCVTTTLNHNAQGKVTHDAASNQRGHEMRSRKLAALQHTLKAPEVYGPKTGDLLIVGWGSTRGTIDEAVDRARAEGYEVSAVNLLFLSPLQPGLKKIFSGFKKVMTIELNYSDNWGDPLITEENRRYSQLAFLLRSHTLMDVDCWSRVPGRPFMPMEIHEVIVREIKKIKGAKEETAKLVSKAGGLK